MKQIRSHARNYTDELSAFVSDNWKTIVAHRVRAPEQIDDYGFLLFIGDLKLPLPLMEVVTGKGGIPVCFLHFRIQDEHGPYWVDVPEEAEEYHPASLYFASCCAEGDTVLAAWEFEPGQIVWAEIDGEETADEAIELLLADLKKQHPSTHENLN